MIQFDRYDETRLNDARAIVRGLSSVLVAYSGGVDSSLLLKVALDELGQRAVAVLASSPAYPESEQEQARDLVRRLGARLVEVSTSEVELEAYRRNNPDRCFHCKEELFETLEPVQRDLGLRHIAYGATADDADGHRPGHGSAVGRSVHQSPWIHSGAGAPSRRCRAHRGRARGDRAPPCESRAGRGRAARSRVQVRLSRPRGLRERQPEPHLETRRHIS